MPKNYQSKASFFDILMTWVVMIVVVLSTIAAVAFDMDVKSISMIAIAVVVVCKLSPASVQGAEKKMCNGVHCCVSVVVNSEVYGGVNRQGVADGIREGGSDRVIYV